MSPLDDELRTLLSDRAEVVRPAPDTLRGVEDRARTLRRRRSGGAVLGAVAAVMAVAVAVPAGIGALTQPPAPAGFAASTAPDPAATDPATAPASAPLGWAFSGDEAVAARMTQPTLDLWQAEHGESGELAPLYARADGVSDVLVAEITSPSLPPALVVAVAGQDSTELFHDAPTPAGAVQVSAVVPAATDSGTALVVLTEPGAEHRHSAFDRNGGVLLSGVPGPAGEVALPEGAAPVSVRVTTEDGRELYAGPPTYDGTPASEPGTVAVAPEDTVDWGPAFLPPGSGALVAAAEDAWQADHPGGVRASHVLAVVSQESGAFYVGQLRDVDEVVWTTVVALPTDRAPVVVLDRTGPVMDLVAGTFTMPGRTGPDTVVVSDPRLLELRYAPDGRTFTVVPRLDGASPGPGLHLLERTGDRDRDALEMVFEDGVVRYDGAF